MPQTLYSPEQVAERLGLHVRTIRSYVRTGRLRAVRIGKQYRIAPKDLAKLTGQPVSSFEHHPFRASASSIVDIEAISPETASRLTNLVVGAAKAVRGRHAGSQAQSIYDPQRMHMKIILVGTMEDNAAYFSLIRGVLEA